MSTEYQVKCLNDDIRSAMDIDKPETVPALLQTLKHADFFQEEIVFDLRRMGASAEAVRALILAKISEPEFGNLRERVRFIFIE